jgi:hypothetical protein
LLKKSSWQVSHLLAELFCSSSMVTLESTLIERDDSVANSRRVNRHT